MPRGRAGGSDQLRVEPFTERCMRVDRCETTPGGIPPGVALTHSEALRSVVPFPFALPLAISAAAVLRFNFAAARNDDSTDDLVVIVVFVLNFVGMIADS